MDPLRRNPLLEITKCEMCFNLVYHFPTGLCARCFTVWAGKKPMDRLRLTVDQSKALLVSFVRRSVAQDMSQMDPTFQRVIAEVRLQRQQKMELFQKIRQQFQLSVLTGPFFDKNPKYEVNEDYWNVPDIVDEDTVMFQHNIDLLADIPTVSSENRKQNL
ncbi:uncharacterized protein LOC27208534 [Drosophila simulans]|uniref:uncharacterized protein LOC27208534 n=1 Tax=Drosophila simulans TaxID=7240 RepID=UPI00078AEBF1|nr:uncharacterized protein LOC27208534 [Drosophila simulans]KMZ04544.1 uncharacterized protein Dsimw501_GD28689 [Drosophila simulans]